MVLLRLRCWKLNAHKHRIASNIGYFLLDSNNYRTQPSHYEREMIHLCLLYLTTQVDPGV